LQEILMGIVKSAPFQMRTKMNDTVTTPTTSRAAAKE
jgi:hypothetical protein